MAVLVAIMELHPWAYVGKRTAMYKSRAGFQCLYQIRLNGILQQGGYSATNTKIYCGEGLIGKRKPKQNIINLPAEFFQPFCKAKCSHDLAGSRYHKPCFRRYPIIGRIQSGNYFSQNPVVNIEESFQQNRFDAFGFTAVEKPKIVH